MNADVEPYVRRVFYYETDNMGIVHHSNYIRWMEEARMDYMRKLGYDYGDMEKLGFIMPVTSVSCKYVTSAHYDDVVTIRTHITAFNGVRLSFGYKIMDESGAILATGESGHCFLENASRKPVNIRKHYKEFYDAVLSICNG